MLKKQMHEAAKQQKFEQAAKIRNRINSLERIEKVKRPWEPERREITGDSTIFELQSALKLKNSPKRIEAFDVSNIAGEETVASMVVFNRGEPLKSHYRKFIIRGVAGPNDVASIKEAVYRRFAKTLKDKMPAPDLLLIDGGIAQARAARAAAKKAGIRLPIIGLAKKEELIFFPGKNIPLKLPRDSNALLLLQKVRDEAHRFAITFHRSRKRRSAIPRFL
ncbi:UvrB/UvrC motif-containing protein [Candidatus Saganbacteria bacterium]|uniref:UvrB/UvrC motif-containing protein n=1 Tax=Candidatus Saganbacteria bacterium TaxID=2575572 RepID=A0A9D6UJX8_UNCSA|nr:UvrB/UvrC motif-containing protein [Candidatus Saganbacteria bacterium]